ncbi:MAG: 50S ribosomal protein L30 [Eubacteriales bacterium]|nr:50S ribosomal protein L30 [Eubacteriales bacterium]
MANKLRVTLVKSPIAQVPKNRLTVAALGFKKMHQTREFNDSPAVRGMLKQIQHMVKVEEI